MSQSNQKTNQMYSFMTKEIIEEYAKQFKQCSSNKPEEYFQLIRRKCMSSPALWNQISDSAIWSVLKEIENDPSFVPRVRNCILNNNGDGEMSKSAKKREQIKKKNERKKVEAEANAGNDGHVEGDGSGLQKDAKVEKKKPIVMRAATFVLNFQPESMNLEDRFFEDTGAVFNHMLHVLTVAEFTGDVISAFGQMMTNKNKEDFKVFLRLCQTSSTYRADLEHLTRSACVSLATMISLPRYDFEAVQFESPNPGGFLKRSRDMIVAINTYEYFDCFRSMAALIRTRYAALSKVSDLEKADWARLETKMNDLEKLSSEGWSDPQAEPQALDALAYMFHFYGVLLLRGKKREPLGEFHEVINLEDLPNAIDFERYLEIHPLKVFTVMEKWIGNLPEFYEFEQDAQYVRKMKRCRMECLETRRQKKWEEFSDEEAEDLLAFVRNAYYLNINCEFHELEETTSAENHETAEEGEHSEVFQRAVMFGSISDCVVQWCLKKTQEEGKEASKSGKKK